MSRKDLRAPLYGIPFTVLLFENCKEAEKWFNKNLPESSFDPHAFNYDGWVTERENVLYVTFVKDKRDGATYPTPGIIAHEALHLMNEIFSKVGYRVDQYNDEPQAYLLTWIVNRIHEFVNEHN